MGFRRALLGIALGSAISACGGRSGVSLEDYVGDGDGDGPSTCELDEDCRAGDRCMYGTCRESCEGSSMCPEEAPYCEPRTETCFECYDGTDCAPGDVCTTGFCNTPICDDGTNRCNGDVVQRCDLAQGGWSTTEVCSSDQTCVDDGSGPACRSLACSPGQAECYRGTLLSVCNADGSGYETIDCAQSGQVCVDEACVDFECAPNQLYCGDGHVRLCSADGLSSSLWETCGDAQTCVESPEPSCEDLFCSPGAIGCLGNLAFECSADGTEFASAEDCGAGTCKSGICHPLICTPGVYSCNPSGDVVLCAQDGTSQTVVDDCTSTEYCETGKTTCRPQVCTPLVSWCTGSNSVTCNANGSGTTIESCAPNACEEGVCQTDLFFEDFEDGDTNGWTFLGNGYTMAVTDATAADGTDFSLTMSGGNANHYDGIYRTFSPGIQPERFGYFARPESLFHGTYLTLHESTGAPGLSNEVAFVYFRAGGEIAVGGATEGSVAVASYTPGVWYYIELAFDWDADTFDIYVNGTLEGSDLGFRGGNRNSIQRITLYHHNDTTGYWDELRAW